MVNVLNPERNKYRKAFCGKGSECVNLACSKGHSRIQSVHLLILENGKLAQMLSCRSKQSFGVVIKLFFGVRSMNHSEYSEHHSLITSGKVIKELLHFLFLLFHIIRNGSGKVIVLILLSLPVGNVRLNPKQSALCFSHGFIGRNGYNINRHHQVAIQVGKLGYHTVLDIGSVLTKKKDSPVTVSHFEVVLFKFHCIRANIILEIVSLFSRFLNIEVVGGFLPDTEEIVDNSQPFIGFKLHTFASESCKVGNQVSTDTGKIGSCVLHALFVDGDSNILILNDRICTGRLVEKHFVIFLSVNIKLIAGFGDKNGFLKVQTVKPSVVDSQLCSSSAVKRVEKLGVFKEHCFLVLTACYGKVNIRELEALGILVLAHTENTVIIDCGNGNTILYALWYYKLFFVLL